MKAGLADHLFGLCIGLKQRFLLQNCWLQNSLWCRVGTGVSWTCHPSDTRGEGWTAARFHELHPWPALKRHLLAVNLCCDVWKTRERSGRSVKFESW